MSDSPVQKWSNPIEEPPQVPEYDLVRPIGSGGFGVVWLARNRTTGLLRAVKLIPLDRARPGNPAGREIGSIIRLENNACAEHPHLLRIHHVGKTEEYLYYVMDPADDLAGKPASTDPRYVPETLQARLDAGALAPEAALEGTRQLLGGLACLHQAGMVHRDVKPSNCLFVGGKLKLADFGLLTDTNRTISRLGTLRYMPPDGRMDARADVYAAGLVIYQMITGLPVEKHAFLLNRAGNIARDPLLKALNRISLRATHSDPADRFTDAAEMLTALERGLQPQRRWRSVAMALGTTLVALIALAIWISRPSAVSVNFVTVPFEATVVLDGQTVVDPQDGKPYTTPCTIPNLPARVYQVTLRRLDGQELDLGARDFRTTREIEVVAP